MRGDYKLTVFAAGCGDCILIEAHHKRCYRCPLPRRWRARRDQRRGAGLRADIRKACGNNHLDVFISTHPDKDHVGGFCELFHCGPPDSWVADPSSTTQRSSSTKSGALPTAPTRTTRPPSPSHWSMRSSGARPAGHLAGDLRQPSGHHGHYDAHHRHHHPGLEWRLLAPTRRPNGTSPRRRTAVPVLVQPTSLVIQWDRHPQLGRTRRFPYRRRHLGRGTERLDREVLANNPEHLAWHILLAPHHCSRRSIGRVWNGGCIDVGFSRNWRVRLLRLANSRAWLRRCQQPACNPRRQHSAFLSCQAAFPAHSRARW